MSDKAGKESQFMFSHSELSSDPPFGSDRESGHDTYHLIFGLRHSYNYMWSGTYYLIIGALSLPTSKLRLSGEVRCVFHLISFLFESFLIIY